MSILSWLKLGGTLAGATALITILMIYNKHQEELGAAKNEAKYAKLRQQGSEAYSRYQERVARNVQETAARRMADLDASQRQLVRNQLQRDLASRQIVNADPVAKNWADEFVPNYFVNQLRVHQQAIVERYGRKTSATDKACEVSAETANSVASGSCAAAGE